jgi:hypothetical protein
VRLPNVAEQQSLQQAQAERRILVWQQNERFPFLEVFRFLINCWIRTHQIGVPTKLCLEGESEGVRLPNAAKQQSLQQAQAERRILVWQQNENLLLGGSYFVSKLMDENPLKGAPQISNLWGE